MQLIVFHVCIYYITEENTKIINREKDQYAELQRL